MTSVSKSKYINKLNDVVNKYNHAYHSTVKMKPVDVKSYTDFDKTSYKEDPKFNVGDYVRILKYKNIFGKGYVPNWSEKFFEITKIKSTVLWIYVISNLKGEENAGMFYEKELQKPNKKEFKIEKVIKRKDDKL